MTAVSLALIAGTVLSLLFSYVPGFNVLFAGLEGTIKRLIMLVILLLVSVVIYGLSCAGWALGGFEVVCDQVGIRALIEMFIIALIANQSMFLATPATKKVREAKA